MLVKTPQVYDPPYFLLRKQERMLCTAMVKPTMSGIIIEERDHVLMTDLRVVSFIFSTFSSNLWKMYGPFLSERGMIYIDFTMLRF